MHCITIFFWLEIAPFVEDTHNLAPLFGNLMDVQGMYILHASTLLNCMVDV